MEIDIEKSPRAQQAMAYFKEGYNCSQAVFLTFADKFDMDKSTALKLSSSFGGGTVSYTHLTLPTTSRV